MMERTNGVFRRGVEGLARERYEPGDATEVDDVSVSLRDETGRDGPNPLDHSEEVDLEHVFESMQALVLHPARIGEARVVDQHVRPAESAPDLVECAWSSSTTEAWEIPVEASCVSDFTIRGKLRRFGRTTARPIRNTAKSGDRRRW